MPKSKENKAFTNLIKGGFIGSTVFIVLTIIICAVLLKIDLSRNTYLPLLMIISALSGMLSGFTSVRKTREKALINGLIASIIPAIIILISMSVAYKGFSFFELIIIACCLFGGIIGGIAAINIKKKRKPIKKR